MFDLDGYPYHMEKTEYTDENGDPIYIVVDLDNAVVFPVAIKPDELEKVEGYFAEAPWDDVDKIPDEVWEDMHRYAREYTAALGQEFRVEAYFSPDTVA